MRRKIAVGPARGSGEGTGTTSLLSLSFEGAGGIRDHSRFVTPANCRAVPSKNLAAAVETRKTRAIACASRATASAVAPTLHDDRFGPGKCDRARACRLIRQRLGSSDRAAGSRAVRTICVDVAAAKTRRKRPPPRIASMRSRPSPLRHSRGRPAMESWRIKKASSSEPPTSRKRVLHRDCPRMTGPVKCPLRGPYVEQGSEYVGDGSLHGAGFIGAWTDGLCPIRGIQGASFLSSSAAEGRRLRPAASLR